LIRISCSNGADLSRLEGIVESGRLVCSGTGTGTEDVPLGISRHRVDLDLTAAHLPDLFIEIPAGSYDDLVLDVSRLRLLPEGGGTSREVAGDTP
jgi:hypothetical protein